MLHKLLIVYSHDVSGAFYKLPDSNTVLYCPRFTGRNIIGEGVFKRVYKGYLFHDGGMEPVAVGIGKSGSIAWEGRLIQKIPFPDAIQLFRAAFTLRHDVHVLVTKFYNMGSVRDLLDDGLKLTRKQKISIAKDVLVGLKCLHEAHIAHRDLHDGNILLNKCPDGTIRAGIVDFGRSCYVYKRQYTKPQGAPHRNPPETILHSFQSINTQKTDLYAFGCFLYRLFFHDKYEGSFLYDCRDVGSMSHKKRRSIFSKVERLYKHESSHILSDLRHASSTKRPFCVFEKDIMLLLHPDPNKRVSLDRVEQDLERL